MTATQVQSDVVLSGESARHIKPLLQLVQHLTSCPTAFVTGIDWDSLEQTVLQAENSGPFAVNQGTTVDWSDSLCRLMFCQGQNQSANMPALAADHPAISAGMQTFVVLPVEVGDELIGTLCAASQQQLELSEHQLQSLQLISGAIASDLKLLQHYQQQQKELRQLQQQTIELSLQARTDALTGLLNRRAFSVAWEQLRQLDASAPRDFALMMLDIDHFKQCNDQLGHHEGDAVLRHVAAALQQLSRHTDLVCRFGGDEFLLLAPDTKSQGMAQLAKRLSEQLRQRAADCTVSIGICATDQASCAELMCLADQALYSSKRNGRNQTHVYQRGGHYVELASADLTVDI